MFFEKRENFFSKPISIFLLSFTSIFLTGIIVAAPVNYISAPGELYVISPSKNKESFDDKDNEEALDEDISPVKIGGTVKGGGISGINGQVEFPDSRSIESILGGEKINLLPQNLSLEEKFDSGVVMARTAVSSNRSKSNIDDYSNSSYDNRADPVGHVAADFAVSPTGAATYNIPIAIPTGIAEVEPSISLQYNSQSSDGIAGRGMGINGLSQISRCGSDLVRDGAIRPVQLDSSDNFCLDGKRLIETKKAGYFVYYQTEIKEYNKIKAYFGRDKQPYYFVIETVAGESLEYGRTSSSRTHPSKPGSSVQYDWSGKSESDIFKPTMSWRLSKTKDIKGNYIKYNYKKSFTNKGTESLIDEIKYTGTRTKRPYAAIKFEYEKREGSVKTTYVGGGAFYNSKRLKKIKITQGEAGSPYTLTY